MPAVVWFSAAVNVDGESNMGAALGTTAGMGVAAPDVAAGPAPTVLSARTWKPWETPFVRLVTVKPLTFVSPAALSGMSVQVAG